MQVNYKDYLELMDRDLTDDELKTLGEMFRLENFGEYFATVMIGVVAAMEHGHEFDSESMANIAMAIFGKETIVLESCARIQFAANTMREGNFTDEVRNNFNMYYLANRTTAPTRKAARERVCDYIGTIAGLMLAKFVHDDGQSSTMENVCDENLGQLAHENKMMWMRKI